MLENRPELTPGGQPDVRLNHRIFSLSPNNEANEMSPAGCVDPIIHCIKRVTGIEPVSSAWKADIIAIILYPLNEMYQCASCEDPRKILSLLALFFQSHTSRKMNLTNGMLGSYSIFKIFCILSIACFSDSYGTVVMPAVCAASRFACLSSTYSISFVA